MKIKLVVRDGVTSVIVNEDNMFAFKKRILIGDTYEFKDRKKIYDREPVESMGNLTDKNKWKIINIEED